MSDTPAAVEFFKTEAAFFAQNRMLKLSSLPEN
jgi:hypothetical protein